MSHKILKRTCSEQRYDETQLIGGLWDRREMDLIQKLIRRAISTIELNISSRQVSLKLNHYFLYLSKHSFLICACTTLHGIKLQTFWFLTLRLLNRYPILFIYLQFCISE